MVRGGVWRWRKLRMKGLEEDMAGFEMLAALMSPMPGVDPKPTACDLKL